MINENFKFKLATLINTIIWVKAVVSDP